MEVLRGKPPNNESFKRKIIYLFSLSISLSLAIVISESESAESSINSGFSIAMFDYSSCTYLKINNVKP